VAAYNLEEFEKGCRDGLAKVINPALTTGSAEFGLATEADILAFIGNGGLEKPEFANTEPWRNNPKPDQEILVDSYNFYSGLDYGYVAFMKGATGLWIVKSLKKNDKPSSRAFLLADKLKKAGLIK
jgi:hypothetical protein